MTYVGFVMAVCAFVLAVWNTISTVRALNNIEKYLNTIYNHITGWEDEE